MVDTNLLVSICFSIITNFAHVVPIPEQDVPPSTNLHHYHIGTPYWPTSFGLTGPNGVGYHVSEGVVQSFVSSQDYFHEQDPDKLQKYAGASILTSNQALQLASNVLKSLLKINIPLTNGMPRISQAGFVDGKQIPFFQIDWPMITPRPLFTVGAAVHVDGRSGRIVFLQLLDPAFLDFDAGRKIMNLVYKPDPSGSLPSYRQQAPVPFYTPPLEDQPDEFALSKLPRETNVVTQAIKAWLDFCSTLGINPGSKTNIEDVDWARTVVALDLNVSTTVPVCNATFISGAGFAALNGAICGYRSADSYYNQTLETEDSVLYGAARLRWEDLASKHEAQLVEKLRIPKELLAPLKPQPRFRVPAGQREAKTFKRLVIDWRTPPGYPVAKGRRGDTTLGLEAEFDLQTGQIKSTAFHAPELIEALVHAKATAE